MMEVKKVLEEMAKGSFYLLVEIIKITFYVLIGFGASASMILLYKMYPETAILIFKPFLSIYTFMLALATIIIFISFLSAFSWCVTEIYFKLKKMREKREETMSKERKKLVEDIVSELNKKKKHNGRNRRY